MAKRGIFCEDCYLWQGGYEVNRCCNYIFIVGKMRPCDPGEKCKVKIRRSLTVKEKGEKE